ncbi:MAG: reverse transcriptase domain-containing protein [bacterium]|nr:reverse transcriptase domain-containing protein [bacterium]
MASQLLVDLFQAYYDARRNKRGTINALRFELDFESELFKLYEEIESRTYEISKSVCFISDYPIKREIFAGCFRDRIIHHLIFNYLNPLCERLFINDSYSCRKGKGTSYGVKRADHFIRSCSKNYKKDCYILKLDIAGYFMSIDKIILSDKIEKIIKRFEQEIKCDPELIRWLIGKVIFHDPTRNCIVKGKGEDWVGLPKSKSLFFAKKNCGLPIGNLTSQLFGNVYLNDLDHFIVYKLGCRRYGRYVDDLLIVHQDKRFLQSLIISVGDYLDETLALKLHPKKIYLQQFKKGVIFLGRIIKPYRIYIKTRIKGNMRRRVSALKMMLDRNGMVEKKDILKLISSLNSYMGILKSCSAYTLQMKFIEMNSALFRGYVCLIGDDKEKNVRFVGSVAGNFVFDKNHKKKCA